MKLAGAIASDERQHVRQRHDQLINLRVEEPDFDSRPRRSIAVAIPFQRVQLRRRRAWRPCFVEQP
jgi:hypothetical protein